MTSDTLLKSIEATERGEISCGVGGVLQMVHLGIVRVPRRVKFVCILLNSARAPLQDAGQLDSAG